MTLEISNLHVRTEEREILHGVAIALLAVEAGDERGVEVLGARVCQLVGHPGLAHPLMVAARPRHG